MITVVILYFVSDGTISPHFTTGLQSKGIDQEIRMTHLCIHESTQLRGIVATKSTIQLTSTDNSSRAFITGDIIVRVNVKNNCA